MENYKKFLKFYKNQFTERISRYENGLDKLIAASEDVKVLQEELKVSTVQVRQKTEEVNKQIDAIESRSEIATRESKVADELKSTLKVEGEQIAKTTIEVETQLADAKPILENAAKAVGNVDPSKLTTLKSYSTPPKAVMAVLSCVLVLKPIKGLGNDLSWGSCKNMLNRVQELKTGLVEYTKSIDLVTQKMINKV